MQAPALFRSLHSVLGPQGDGKHGVAGGVLSVPMEKETVAVKRSTFQCWSTKQGVPEFLLLGKGWQKVNASPPNPGRQEHTGL